MHKRLELKSKTRLKLKATEGGERRKKFAYTHKIRNKQTSKQSN